MNAIVHLLQRDQRTWKHTNDAIAAVHASDAFATTIEVVSTSDAVG